MTTRVDDASFGANCVTDTSLFSPFIFAFKTVVDLSRSLCPLSLFIRLRSGGGHLARKKEDAHAVDAGVPEREFLCSLQIRRVNRGVRRPSCCPFPDGDGNEPKRRSTRR